MAQLHSDYGDHPLRVFADASGRLYVQTPDISAIGSHIKHGGAINDPDFMGMAEAYKTPVTIEDSTTGRTKTIHPNGHVDHSQPKEALSFVVAYTADGQIDHVASANGPGQDAPRSSRQQENDGYTSLVKELQSKGLEEAATVEETRRTVARAVVHGENSQVFAHNWNLKKEHTDIPSTDADLLGANISATRARQDAASPLQRGETTGPGQSLWNSRLRTMADFATDVIPVAGLAKDGLSVATGKDPIANELYTTQERIEIGLFALGNVVPGGRLFGRVIRTGIRPGFNPPVQRQGV